MNTSDNLPTEILVEELPDGVHYTLPMRRLGVRLLPLAAALLLAAGGLFSFLFWSLANSGKRWLPGKSLIS